MEEMMGVARKQEEIGCSLPTPESQKNSIAVYELYYLFLTKGNSNKANKPPVFNAEVFLNYTNGPSIRTHEATSVVKEKQIQDPAQSPPQSPPKTLPKSPPQVQRSSRRSSNSAFIALAVFLAIGATAAALFKPLSQPGALSSIIRHNALTHLICGFSRVGVRL